MTSQEMLRVLSKIDNMDFDITMHSYSTLKQNQTSETSSKIWSSDPAFRAFNFVVFDTHIALKIHRPMHEMRQAIYLHTVQPI